MTEVAFEIARDRHACAGSLTVEPAKTHAATVCTCSCGAVIEVTDKEIAGLSADALARAIQRNRRR